MRPGILIDRAATVLRRIALLAVLCTAIAILTLAISENCLRGIAAGGEGFACSLVNKIHLNPL